MNVKENCINGSEIVSLLWKIGSDPWLSNNITPFIQGDTATALLKVELNDCDSFEGLTLEAFVQVPNPDNDLVKIHATIDSDNKAIFTLPTELLWWPGGYTINFMFTEGDKVNYSNIINNAYTVNENPVLAGQNPPTILPGDKAEYEDLIARLNAENTRAETNLPLLEAENERAEKNIVDAGNINTELESTIADAETAKTDLEGTITDSETAKSNLEQTITDSETAKTNLEGTITDAGQAQSDLQDKIDEVPALIQSITDEGDTQVNRVTTEGDTQENRVINEGDTQVIRIGTEGNTQVTNVQNEGNAQVDKVINEGDTQVVRVGDKGDEEYQRLNDLIQTSPTGGNAITLDGRTRTSFEEDIESRAYALDNRLVYAFVPGERNLENLKNGVHIDNPLTNGDGTIKSEDTDSLAGIFNDEDGSFYCGEGYENLIRDQLNLAGLDIEFDGYKIKLTKTANAGNVARAYFLEGSYIGDTDYTVSWNVVEGYQDFDRVIVNNQAFQNLENFYEKKGSEKRTTIPNPGNLGIGLYFKNSSVQGSKFTVEFSITKTSQQVPFVKDTAPDGKVIIKEPWTDVDYTILNLDKNGTEQEYYIDSNGLNLHLKNDGITRNNYVSFAGVYEKITLQSDIDNEILKANSGQLYVHNTGVYEPVQGAKKRANEYGKTKDYVYVSSDNTDIQLVETNKIVTTSIDGVVKRDVIDNTGAITGDGGIVDVNGYIRLATNVKTKVVIEVE